MSEGDALWRPDENIAKRALAVAHEVVSAPDAGRALTRYYTIESDYAGATFASLEPQDAGRITPTDLLATSTLSVDIPPIAVRRLTDDAEMALRIARLLEQLDPSLDISEARDHVAVMSEFYELVKSALHKVGDATSNAWVTASKICARKRPRLFPVRDRVVVDVLGLKGNYPDDWPVFSAVMADEDLRQRIDTLVSQVASGAGVDVGDPTMTLKHLDVLLWMKGR